MYGIKFADGHIEKVRYYHEYFTDNGIFRIDIYTEQSKYAYFNVVEKDEKQTPYIKQCFGESEHFINDKCGFIGERLKLMDYIPGFIHYLDGRVS